MMIENATSSSDQRPFTVIGECRAAGAFLGFALLSVVFWSGHAFGHAHLDASSPEDGAVVVDQPDKVLLVFSEAVDPQFSQFGIYDDALSDGTGGETVLTGEPAFDVGDDLTESGRGYAVAVPVEEPLEAGEYSLVWEVLARDGHVTDGRIRFTISDQE